MFRVFTKYLETVRATTLLDMLGPVSSGKCNERPIKPSEGTSRAKNISPRFRKGNADRRCVQGTSGSHVT